MRTLRATAAGFLLPGAVAAGLLLPGAAAAQETAPLTKSELVRLLTGDAYSSSEVVAMVRRSCLTFEPTSSDRDDFRRLGAGSDLLRAIDECAEQPLTAALRPGRLTLAAGTAGRVGVAVSRGGRPAPGIRVTLGGSEGIEGSGGRPVTGTTDADGRTELEVPAGRRARTYRLPLAAAGAELEDAPVLRLDVVPGRPVSARLSPARLEVEAGRDTAVRVRASVRDAFGNAASGRRLVLRSPALGDRDVVVEATDAGGEAELVVDGDLLREGGTLLLEAGDRVLAELPVEVRASDFEAAADRSPERAGDRRPAAAAGEPREAPRADAAREPDAEGEEPPTGEPAAGEPPAGEPAGGEASGRREAEILIGQGYRELSAGRPGTAATRFRSALEADPESARALEGLARATAAGGEAAEAAALYERAAAAAPEDLELRLALARALDRADRRDDAERVYGEILTVQPERTDVARELALLRSQPYRVELSGWGGAMLEEGSDPALRAAEASLLPSRHVRVWGRYDRSLGLEHPPLLRGRDQVEGYFGGLALLWGPHRRLATRVEVGRRMDDVADLGQNVVRLEQAVRVPASRSYVEFTLGGYVGRWFDRDDWMAYGRVEAPVGERWSVGPALFVGETVGTHTSVTGRSAEQEVRFLLPLAYRHPDGWSVEPGVAVGFADGINEDASGALAEARLLLGAPIAGPHRFRVFLLHHSAPGEESFRVATAGLWLRLQ